jgi:hypothetical protein
MTSKIKIFDHFDFGKYNFKVLHCSLFSDVLGMVRSIYHMNFGRRCDMYQIVRLKPTCIGRELIEYQCLLKYNSEVSLLFSKF